MAFRILFAESVADHLAALTAAERARLLNAVGRQLLHQPLVETRNRKPLRPNPVAPWELRVGRLRVFYDVAEQSATVRVLAVGKKEGHVLRIGGKEIKL